MPFHRRDLLLGAGRAKEREIDADLGTAWRYGQPILATLPKTGNTGTALYWRYGVPLTIYTAR